MCTSFQEPPLCVRVRSQKPWFQKMCLEMPQILFPPLYGTMKILMILVISITKEARDGVLRVMCIRHGFCPVVMCLLKRSRHRQPFLSPVLLRQNQR